MRLYELLLENRAVALTTKYSAKILSRANSDHSITIRSEAEIPPLLADLESKFKKYTEWVLIRWLNGNFLMEDLPRVTEALSTFDTKKHSLSVKDINQYRTLVDLEDALGLLDDVKTARQQKQEIKKSGIHIFVNNDTAFLAHLKTKEAAQFYGKGTKWCTAGDKHNMFYEYNRNGPIYLIIDKTDNSKYQVHFESGSCMDVLDDPFSYDKILQIVPELKSLDPGPESFFKPGVDHDTVNIVQYLKTFHNGKRIPSVEKRLMRTSLVVDYAFEIINGPWPEAERYMVKKADSWDVMRYAINLRNDDRWPEAEPLFAQDGEMAGLYAKRVIKGPWAEIETDLLKTPEEAMVYLINVRKGMRWPEAEPIFIKDPMQAARYAVHALGQRWKKAEDVIKTTPGSATYYAKWVIKRRWPEAEATIMTDPSAASEYAIDLNTRWLEAESIISNAGGSAWEKYVKHFGINHDGV